MIPLFSYSLLFSQSSPDLQAAIKANDIAAVQRHLNTGSGSNSIDDEGDPALMNAVLYASPQVVELLLKKGANPNARNTSAVYYPFVPRMKEATATR